MSEDLAHLFERRAAELALPIQQFEHQQGRMELLRLQIGAQNYALRTLYVDEVVRWEGGRRVPGAGAWVLGVFARRGQIVTVVDLARRLGHGESTCLQVIVLTSENRKLGLAVPQVEEITHQEGLKPAPTSVSPQILPLIEGLLDDGTVLLNAPFLLNPEAFGAA